MQKKILFGLFIVAALLFATQAVSASGYDYGRYNYYDYGRYNYGYYDHQYYPHYSYHDYTDYSKTVRSSPWGRTVEIRTNKPGSSSYYYKSSSYSSNYVRAYNYWGYNNHYDRGYYWRY